MNKPYDKQEDIQLMSDANSEYLVKELKKALELNAKLMKQLEEANALLNAVVEFRFDNAQVYRSRADVNNWYVMLNQHNDSKVYPFYECRDEAIEFAKAHSDGVDPIE